MPFLRVDCGKKSYLALIFRKHFSFKLRIASKFRPGTNLGALVFIGADQGKSRGTQVYTCLLIKNNYYNSQYYQENERILHELHVKFLN